MDLKESSQNIANEMKMKNIFENYFPSSIFEYDTPKIVTVKNVPMGILRLILQTSVICFLVLYQLWYSRGYQTFCGVESSLMIKVKGFAM